MWLSHISGHGQFYFVNNLQQSCQFDQFATSLLKSRLELGLLQLVIGKLVSTKTTYVQSFQ